MDDKSFWKELAKLWIKETTEPEQVKQIIIPKDDNDPLDILKSLDWDDV